MVGAERITSVPALKTMLRCRLKDGRLENHMINAQRFMNEHQPSTTKEPCENDWGCDKSRRV